MSDQKFPFPFLEKKFLWTSSWFWVVVILSLSLRFFWISHVVMVNDEVYYWDWSRTLQLSYLDAPPFVAWIASLGSHFFHGALGARFFIPILHFSSTIFLIKSAKIIVEKDCDFIRNYHILLILFMTELVPVFNLEGVFLLPDASLLLGLSGALYFLIKFHFKNKRTHFFQTSFCFGFFLGLSGLSKYHAFPIAVGFFISFLFFYKKIDFKRYFLFFILSSIIAIIIVSPVLIWNAQNNFASFRFQSLHGFGGMHLDFRNFLRFFLGVILYLFPWFFLSFFIFVIKEIKEKSFVSSASAIVIVPFFLLFFLILLSSLGNQALPHWVMPGFFLLIPFFVVKWQTLREKIPLKWKIFLPLSFVLCFIFPTLLSLEKSKNFLIDLLVFFKGSADPLAQVYQWQDLQNEILKQRHLKIVSRPYDKTTECDFPYNLASLRWFSTAQMAFNFTHQPRVFNFDFNHSSFYEWRDHLPELAGCRFLVLGYKNHFNELELKQVMNIESVQKFSLTPYVNTDFVIVKGVMKDKEILKKFYLNLKENIRY